MELLEGLLTRRSVRKYENKPIPKDVLEQIIKAGEFARTADLLVGGVGENVRVHDGFAVLFLASVGVGEAVFIAGFQTEEACASADVELVFHAEPDSAGKVGRRQVGLRGVDGVAVI